MRRERGLSSAASCSGFSDRENRRKLYIIYRFGENGQDCSSPVAGIHHQALG